MIMQITRHVSEGLKIGESFEQFTTTRTVTAGVEWRHQKSKAIMSVDLTVEERELFEALCTQIEDRIKIEVV